MSDPTQTGQRSPLSSSSSHASGTSALSVTGQSDITPNASMSGQDDVTAPAPYAGGEATPQAQDETNSTVEAEASPAETSGSENQPETAEAEPADEPEAPEFVYASEPATETYAAANEVSAPDPEDEPLAEAASAELEDASTEISEFFDEPAYEASPEIEEHEPPVVEVPSFEDAAPADPEPAAAFSDPASELRATARQTIAENEARQAKALELFEQVSRRFTAAMEEAGEDAARVTFKVMEFAQASLKNNLELAKAYTAARSVPDIFGLHTAYITRQFELLNAQAEELREITAKIAMRNSATLKPLQDIGGKPADHR